MMGHLPYVHGCIRMQPDVPESVPSILVISLMFREVYVATLGHPGSSGACPDPG